MDHSFPKKLRLLRPADFRKVYSLRCSLSDAWLVVFARPNGLAYTRIGLTVSKRYGPAVRRVRLRRLYREAFRLNKADLPLGFDLVIQPRSSNEPDRNAITRSLVTLAGRLARRLTRDAKCSEPDLPGSSGSVNNS